MKGPLFYQKILLEKYGIIRDSKGLSIPYNFIMVRSKEMKTLPEAIASNASLKRFASYLETLQSEQSDLVSFDIEVLKAILKLECILIPLFLKDRK
jgi:mevalonate kinase